ncbi:MAG: hypothetical protein IPO12_01875 [Flavobacteriales bacterium]|nr:hypothetical protein [Flavobacteriales bacterium]
MMGSVFTRFENQVVFRIARGFWHIFVWVSWAAIVLGVLAWLWSITPTGKREVSREAYPPEIEVTARDLVFKEPEPAPLPSVPSRPSVPAVPWDGEEENDVDEGMSSLPDPLIARYGAYVDSLAHQHPGLLWERQGQYRITDQFKYNYYTKKGDQQMADRYRMFVPTGEGLRDRFERFFAQVAPKDYRLRIDLLRALFNELNAFGAGDEGTLAVLQVVLRDMAHSAPTLVERWRRSFRFAVAFATDRRTKAFRHAVGLVGGMDDEKDRTNAAFMDSAIVSIHAFRTEQRWDAWRVMQQQRESRFMQEPTRLLALARAYLPLLNSVPNDHQAEGLSQFITLYLDRNHEREQIIAQINGRYQQALGEAQMEHQRKEANKRDLGEKAWMGVVGGVVVIALVALLLAVLSMQRAITRLQTVIEYVARQEPTGTDDH